MFSEEKRKTALDLYFSTDIKMPLTRLVAELGYPSVKTMGQWIESDPRHALDTRSKKSTLEEKKLEKARLRKEERQFVVDLYFSMKPRISPVRFIEELGYPSRQSLMKWLQDDPRYDRDVSMYKAVPFETKLTAVKMYEAGHSGGSVMKKLGIGNKTSVYLWHRAWKEKGVAGLLPEWRVLQMSERIRKNEDDAKEEVSSESTQHISPNCLPITDVDDDLFDDLPDDPEVLKAMVHRLQLKLAISEEVLDILKADPRIKTGELTSKEKTIVASRLEGHFSLKIIFQELKLKRSTYYYNLESLTRPDKHRSLKERITCIFEGSNYTFGSERIWATIRDGSDGNPPKKISEKVVRRLMFEEGCIVIYRRRRQRGYSSYKGEISKAPEDLVKRNFHAKRPNELWLTDITEFKLPNASKVYLSAIIDCFDGKPIAWKSSLHPTSKLANKTLKQACEQKTNSESPIIHSDRGAHYRWPKWITLCTKNNLVRSMSALGCSPDNAAMEGFFGTLKNEFFYYRDWSDVTAEAFMSRLDEYLRYHCETRIKKSLGWMSPNQYRQGLGKIA